MRVVHYQNICKRDSSLIGQDLVALEGCFPNQKEFNDYTLKTFKWNYTMCHLYIGYHWFLNDYPVFVYSTLPWTTIRNECTRWRRWLDSDEARSLPNPKHFSTPLNYPK